MKHWTSYKQLQRNPQELIHPAGRSPEEYEASGRADAEFLEREVFQDGDKILEYGCGDGRILKHLKHRNIWGVDLVHDFVNNARIHSAYVFGIDDGTVPRDFDVIYSISVFIHLTDEHAEAAMYYIYNHLKPGGRAYLQIPIYDKHTSPRDFMDVRTWSYETFKMLIGGPGFICKRATVNHGVFSFTNIGTSHTSLQILERPVNPVAHKAIKP